MTTRTRSYSRIPSEKHRFPRRSVWLFVGCLLIIISIACNCNIPGLDQKLASGNPSSGGVKLATGAAPSGPAQITATVPPGAGFSAADCAAPGVTFPAPSVGFAVDNVHNGPYIYCSFSQTGAHGLSDTAYIGITAYQPAELEQAYQGNLEAIRGFVTQAQEWNALPDLPAEIRQEITMIREDETGYVFMITGWANVQECLLGTGHGAEKVNGKYLVITQYESCELGDSAAYTAALENLRAAALAAIQRVEAGAQ